jgi:ubiquinone/menaquinone biosynthesis C-methylase UbiE
LPDNYFDLVTGYSVFTHINETETSWLLELRRILKIGGIALLTIHDETTWQNQVPSLRATVVAFRPDIADLPEMPKGKTVATFREDDPYNCNVFHSREHIESVWGRFFEICEIKSLYFDQQAVVVCRRLT